MSISAFAATGEAEIIASSQSAELTIFGLFLAADPIVKFVMFLLVGASIWCWAIIFDKIKLARTDETIALIDYTKNLADVLA